MRWWRIELTRRRQPRQEWFEFAKARERRERWFKRGIVLGTTLVVIAAIAGTEAGRYLVGRVAFEVRSAAERWIGLPPDRTEIEADWKRRRERDVEQTRRVYREVYAEATNAARKLLDFGELDPDSGVLRWGNYDRILLLPATVFLPDDHGRSYRLRPNTRSIWLRNFDLPRGLAGFFLMPDTPELPRMIEGTGARIVPGSTQTTNSWGCRGPEPDLSAPVRGLILGDSNMQGLFIGDADTPP